MPNPYLTLVESWKDLPPGTKWTEPDDTGKIEIFAPLEVAGVTVGSFALRATCNTNRVDADVLFQLEIGIPGSRTRLPLARIEWRPLSPIHKNPAVNCQPSPLITGSHHHTHQANWLEEQGKMREGNLPFAIALDPDPATFDELLDLVRVQFRINGITRIKLPQWQLKMVY
jgi:hypothetical protein